jgi:hypothetical protein
MRYASLFLIGTLVFIVSCSDDTVTASPTGPEALTAAAASVTNVVTVNEDPWGGPVDYFVPCANGGAGEVVRFSELHSGTFHVTISANRVTMHGNGSHRLRGAGLSTGDQYQNTYTAQWNFSGSLINGQFSELVINVHDVTTGPGPGNNFLVHATYRVIVNANGDVTVERDDFRIECK